MSNGTSTVNSILTIIALTRPAPGTTHDVEMAYFKAWVQQNGGLGLASHLLAAGEDGPGSRRFTIDPSTKSAGHWCWWDTQSATESEPLPCPNEAAIEAAAVLINCAIDLEDPSRTTWSFADLIVAVKACCSSSAPAVPAATGDKDSEKVSFAAILEMLGNRSVVATNLHPAPPSSQLSLPDRPYRLEFCGSAFYVHRGEDEAKLTFNEAQAASAHFIGDRFTMRDAQGFMIDLDLAPEPKTAGQEPIQFCNKSVEAACAAIGAHQQSLLIDGDPSVQLWHLFASLHEWCAVYGVDFDEELKEFKATFHAGELSLPLAFSHWNAQRETAMNMPRRR